MASFERTDTSVKVAAIIAGKLNIDKNDVSEEATLQDLGADSLDLVEIIMKLEEDFGLEIKDDDAENLTNVSQVVDYVQASRTK